MAELDRAVAEVKAKADEFAQLPPGAKAELLREVQGNIVEVAPEWIREACRAKGIRYDGPMSGEEWLAGPLITVRNTRLLMESLNSIARFGRPPFGRGARTREDGRVEIDVFPVNTMDRVLFREFSARFLLSPGVTETQARERQAPYYQNPKPDGRVTLVLGAGNVASIPPTDVFYKMFVCGHVCILKVNPINEWIGPILERALSLFIKRDYLRIVYGGSEVGAYLIQHPEVDEIHLTGNNKTHDLIVWGPPGLERDRRKASGDPVLKKPITSELGNVSPVAVVPADYSDKELWFQARNIVTMVVNNGSFNCNAARVLIVARGWSKRERFIGMIKQAFKQTPIRKDYYPGSRLRYQELLSGRKDVETFGQPTDVGLPWALLSDIDQSDTNRKLFTEENFCGILAVTAIGSADPVEFLTAVTLFCNEKLWGNLNATLIVHPGHEKTLEVANALDRAILDLRYGTVAINHWPAIGYGILTPPWGGHPTSTLTDCQSGNGWVHNTFMIENIEKAVIRGPLVTLPKPAWFYDNRQAHRIGEKMVSLEAAPSWFKIPGLVITALRG